LKVGGDEFHFDVLVDDLVKETGETVKSGVEVDGGLQFLTAGKSQQFASESGGAVCLLADMSKAFGDDGIRTPCS
jgi:hypothetical protein